MCYQGFKYSASHLMKVLILSRHQSSGRGPAIELKVHGEFTTEKLEIRLLSLGTRARVSLAFSPQASRAQISFSCKSGYFKMASYEEVKYRALRKLCDISMLV